MVRVAFDALVAATALAHDLPVYTCNPGDFSGIGGLEAMAVPQPRRLTPDATSPDDAASAWSRKHDTAPAQ